MEKSKNVHLILYYSVDTLFEFLQQAFDCFMILKINKGKISQNYDLYIVAPI